jgi:hypothetical protein
MEDSPQSRIVPQTYGHCKLIQSETAPLSVAIWANCDSKRLLIPTAQGVQSPNEDWLDLDRAAAVEVTSDEKNYGIESALVSGEAQGWRAASPGTQTIRLLFDQPQKLKRISLVFEETGHRGI